MFDRFRSRGRLLAIVIVSAATLTACGGDDSDPSAASSEAPSVAPPVTASNQAPTISGKAPASVAAGKAYAFQPAATDGDQDSLTFSVESLPMWAKFDSKTGRITGTPATAHIGSHENIVVKVSDGKVTTALPEFSVTVTDANGGGPGNATLSWQAPDTNIDGSALMNLTGYRIHYGTSSGTYTKTIKIDTVGMTTYVVENLPPGTYYFAISSVAANGTESELSGEASTTI
jgi:hypothetical protein